LRPQREKSARRGARPLIKASEEIVSSLKGSKREKEKGKISKIKREHTKEVKSAALPSMASGLSSRGSVI
jgi:hypothetical protein